ncbi:unnamed protein product [Microthlaspi erraticum]|uniref:MATH domain-containing protein n=1 Tax=Microthlaspi erraticum TaxID=1685480 RepID=A0A6D2J238_9BRAS|nr:unnamed protein product [Microthlaspi erraticum]
MESQKQTSFTFEIDNFSEKEAPILSPNFFSGGCEWYAKVYPKGAIVDDHLALYLYVANSKSLRLGWKRQASYSFFLLNKSGQELFKTKEVCKLFCAQFSAWGYPKFLPLKQLQANGVLEKNKLRVKVEVKVVEVVDEGVVTGKETLDVKGFQVLYPQVISVTRLFTEHPDIALNLRLKDQFLKTTYMNILLGLIDTLNKPPHDISETELSNASNKLCDLTEAGFKLDWLKTKLDEVSLEKKKSNVQVQELEEHIKNLTLELNKEKGITDTCAAKVLLLEKTVWDLKYELNKEKRESAAEFLSLEQTVSDLKEELKKERHESYGYVAKVILLEETVCDLKDKLNKEKGKSDTCDAKVLFLEQTVLKLKDELNKEKGKSDTCAAKVFFLEQTVLKLKDELNKEKGKSDTSAAEVLSLEQTVSDLEDEASNLEDEASDLKQEVSDLKDELNKEKGKSGTSGAKVLSLEQTVSDLKHEVSDLKDELNKEKDESDTCAAKVLSLEQTVSDLGDVLNKEKGKSDTLEQAVLNLRAELNKEKAAVCSWEVLDYEDLPNDK